ncbi:PLD nuclease N-terminal domain-containing protein [Jatrophihabitans endophyticus]|uniref:PLD nuclease N-terminal domain-containing protein n=1 Tax=Jatrophihabitans endophyticus TaxID=1206085 RepID=UPI0009FCC9B3|nr:PLD nuclease N-terminal domain-containing protein [Jatrophihabitans endophyticus]
MLYADGLLGLILFGLWLFCVIDVITTDESSMRNLPKLPWVLIVVLLFDIGALAWLIAGRPWPASGPRSAPTRTSRAYPEYDRPGRHVPQNPDDDDAFLAQVRARAEEQRRQYQERRKRELDDERGRLTRRPEDDQL